MYRVIYRSRSCTPIDWTLIDSILESSLKNNVHDSIGGILLCTDHHFLQVLEGDFQHVNQSLSRIYNDDRHTDVELISFHEIEDRMFQNWGMRTIGVFDIDDPIKQGLREKYGCDIDDSHFPAKEWSVLSMIHDIKRLENLPEKNHRKNP